MSPEEIALDEADIAREYKAMRSPRYEYNWCAASEISDLAKEGWRVISVYWNDCGDCERALLERQVGIVERKRQIELLEQIAKTVNEVASSGANMF